MSELNDLPPQRLSSIKPSGKREKVLVADVSGIFQRYKKLVFGILVAIYIIMPWIHIGGHPAIFLDIENRHFFLFGLTFNAQDAYLVFFLITGVIFSLIYITALAGRVWCGWACPQTVFLEGFFRRVERWIEGPKSQQILLRKGPWTSKKIFKFVLKHFLFILLSLFVAHIFLSYFVSLDHLFSFMTQNPAKHSTAFGWVMALTLLIYGNFAWFREQLCLIVCPYGRLQSALLDDDSVVIGYDKHRGEPRGKKNDPNRGACIDCHRCLEVCPTGIDIRNGLQLECVGCANCIDACNEIMLKINQPTGLIRYDSHNGLEGKKRRLLRPRMVFYTFLFFLGVAVFSFFLMKRHPFEANILRLPGTPYVIQNNQIRNSFQIHIINKSSVDDLFFIQAEYAKGVSVILPQNPVDLKSLEDRTIPLFINQAEQEYVKGEQIKINVINLRTGQMLKQSIPLLGP